MLNPTGSLSLFTQIYSEPYTVANPLLTTGFIPCFADPFSNLLFCHDLGSSSSSSFYFAQQYKIAVTNINSQRAGQPNTNVRNETYIPYT